MHTLTVKCEVEADPPDSVRFSWTYNNTRNVSPVSVYLFYIVRILDYFTILDKSYKVMNIRLYDKYKAINFHL